MDQGKQNWNYEIPLAYMLDWARYFGEYIWVVDLIFERAKAAETTVIARPQLFLIRHTLELGYKANIIFLEKLSGLSSDLKFKSHSLEYLHREFDRHFQEIVKKYHVSQDVVRQYEDLSEKLSNLKNIQHDLDAGSYSFRYPMEKDGVTPSINGDVRLNMMDVYELYETSKVILKYTADVVMEFVPEAPDLS